VVAKNAEKEKRQQMVVLLVTVRGPRDGYLKDQEVEGKEMQKVQHRGEVKYYRSRLWWAAGHR
jgi:hypothetical protein